MDTLLSGSTDEATRGNILYELRADITKFGNDVIEHLHHEERAYATPVARKVGELGCTSRVKVCRRDCMTKTQASSQNMSSYIFVTLNPL